MTRVYNIVSSMLLLGVVVTLTMIASEKTATAVDKEELWVGHQAVFGKTTVPILGDKQTRTDSYLLASVKREKNAIELTQLACKVTFKQIAGIKIDIPTKSLLKLPKAHIRFESENKFMKAAPWKVGWFKKDIDGDGFPGLSVDVDASICSGKLHVASSTRSAAVAMNTEDGLAGKISVHVKQKILGSDSACLKTFSSDSEEKQNGGFAYRRVPADTTCEKLLKGPWPITAKFEPPKLK